MSLLMTDEKPTPTEPTTDPTSDPTTEPDGTPVENPSGLVLVSSAGGGSDVPDGSGNDGDGPDPESDGDTASGGSPEKP